MEMALSLNLTRSTSSHCRSTFLINDHRLMGSVSTLSTIGTFDPAKNLISEVGNITVCSLSDLTFDPHFLSLESTLLTTYTFFNSLPLVLNYTNPQPLSTLLDTSKSLEVKVNLMELWELDHGLVEKNQTTLTDSIVGLWPPSTSQDLKF